jgi:hypothetical protein
MSIDAVWMNRVIILSRRRLPWFNSADLINLSNKSCRKLSSMLLAMKIQIRQNRQKVLNIMKRVSQKEVSS